MSYESNIENCGICHKIAFEPRMCERCYELEAARLKAEGSTSRAWVERRCTDCRGDCEVCLEGFCEEHINAHGCKRQADPADVMVLEGAYIDNPIVHLDEVYSINGRTYFVLRNRYRSHAEPVDVHVHRYKGAGERDVLRGDVMEARPYIDDEEVGKVNADGGTDWYDEDEVAEADHAAAEDR